MPKTLFRPQIDGSGFEFINEIEKKEISAARRKFKAAIKASLDSLRPLYSAALKIYDIKNSLVDSVASDIPPEFLLHSGKIYFTLDYYYARRYFPKSVSKNEKKSAHINAFFRDRIAASIKANAVLLLGNTAIAYMIPDRWLPESWLIDPIKAEIKHMAFVKDSTIELNLKLPSGGNLWLKDTCRKEWDRLKNYIDAGKPWPIRLIGASLNPYLNRSVIAYGYKEPGDGSGTVYVYDLKYPAKEHLLKLRFQGEAQIAVASFDGSPHDNIRGFYCEYYSEEPPPLLGRFQFFRKIFPIKPIWYSTRCLHILWLWMRGDSR